jgi:hypothetical protein
MSEPRNLTPSIEDRLCALDDDRCFFCGSGQIEATCRIEEEPASFKIGVCLTCLVESIMLRYDLVTSRAQ